jgi:hypothetical protein
MERGTGVNLWVSLLPLRERILWREAAHLVLAFPIRGLPFFEKSRAQGIAG